MKLIKSLAIGLVAAASASSAFAGTVTVMHVTGSTAFRAATSNAILGLFSGGSVSYASDGATYNSSNYQIISGTTSGGAAYLIKTNWSGSVAGLRDVTKANAIAFLADNTPTSPTGSVAAISGTGSYLTDSAAPECAMTDNLQSSSTYTSPSLVEAATGSPLGVGIVPFAFVASKTAPAAMTNVTTELAKNVFQNGYTSAAEFTNNLADADTLGGTRVYAIGRDNLSGTRVQMQACTGIGVLTSLKQYQIDTVTSGSVTNISQSASSAVGQTSGGTLAGLLRNDTTNINDTTNGYTGKACFLSYLGENDSYVATATGATTGLLANAHYLTFNGVKGFDGVLLNNVAATVTSGSPVITLTGTAPSVAAGLVVGQAVKATTGIPADSYIVSIDAVNNTFTINANATANASSVTVNNILPNNIRTGAYTFWGYEHLYSLNTTTAKAFATLLGTRIKSTDYFASGIANDTAMHAKRTGDGTFVLSK